MPVDCAIPMQVVEQEAFHALDKRVMRLAFDIHNDMGRFWDERIYQNELAQRCQDDGLESHREAAVRVTYQDFEKIYLLDLVVAGGVIYELKAAETLTGEHETQLIHYLLLTGQQHGKLLNFRPSAVESKFVSSRLTPGKRKDFALDIADWLDLGESSARLLRTAKELLEDWGAFLAVELYKEAVVHLFGGEEQVIQPVQVLSHGRVLGRQKVCLLDPTTAFHLSAASEHAQTYEQHLQRFLNHTNLAAIQWLNFDKHRITCRTIRRSR